MKGKSQPLEDSAEDKRRGISRREMVQRLMGGGAGGVLVAVGATTHSAQAHSMGLVTPDKEGVKAATAESAPLFLDPHQKETLFALAERIVPGSTKAGVAGFVDLLLSVDTLEDQKNFVASLSAMDAESLRRYGSPFKDLTEARQNEFLTSASTPTHGRPSGNENGFPAGSAVQPGLPSGVLHEHFENLKGWVSKAYYSSEVGMRELGWTDNYFFPTFPGCEDAGS